MKIAAALVLALVSSACAAAKPPVAEPVAPTPGPSPTARLADAKALLRIGCLDCLHEAYRAFESLSFEPLVSDRAAIGAIQSSALIALRERGLGMSDSGSLVRARELASARNDLQVLFDTALDVIEATPARLGQVIAPVPAAREPSARSTAAPLGTLQQNRARWLALLGAAADEDVLAASLWVSFSCGNSPTTAGRSPDALLAPLAEWRDAPAVLYEVATCGRLDAAPLEALVAGDARFHEADYWLGFRELGRLELDGAQALLMRAYQWHSNWPSVAVALAGLYMTAEEFAAALDHYDQALTLLPGLADALVGRVRALSYLGRSEDAIAGTAHFLTAVPREAYYWRAWNRNELKQVEEAWADITQAERFGPNSEVAKLAGVIAFQRGDLMTARDRFETARRLNPDDCDSHFYLGGVQAGLKAWVPSAEAYLVAEGCLESAQTRLAAEIAVIEASNAAADRKAHRIASRHQKIALADRMLRQSWYNIAANYFNVGRSTDARSFAEKVIDDEHFGELARLLLAELTQKP